MDLNIDNTNDNIDKKFDELFDTLFEKENMDNCTKNTPNEQVKW